jgi:NDP-sugar pyrophosphorylase family protein
MGAAIALVMAGGRGERMAASGVRTPKPLVPVAGTTLLEHNVRLLLHWGLDRVAVSVDSPDGPVAEHCRTHLVPLVQGAGGTLDLLAEEVPMGNIGSAGLLADRGADVVVVFADNLTTLDLRLLLAHHRAEAAHLTLACHEHGFRIPYGRVETDGTRVLGYAEKPVVPVTVASAVSVLGAGALAVLGSWPHGGPVGLVDLTRALLGAGRPVAAYHHGADWVDVNDAVTVGEAVALVQRHPQLFPPGAGRGIV